MLTSIDLTGIKYTIDDNTRKYVIKKIGQIDKYLPRHARQSATAEVRLKYVNQDHGNKHQAEVVLTLPDRQITAKDCTTNMLAAVDIVEAKLKTQLQKYKREHISHFKSRGIMSRFKRSFAREL